MINSNVHFFSNAIWPFWWPEYWYLRGLGFDMIVSIIVIRLWTGWVSLWGVFHPIIHPHSFNLYPSWVHLYTILPYCKKGLKLPLLVCYGPVLQNGNERWQSSESCGRKTINSFLRYLWTEIRLRQTHGIPVVSSDNADHDVQCVNEYIIRTSLLS